MRVFLIHGMGRTSASMWLLALRLRLNGHRPSLFGYAVTVEPLDRIAERFERHVASVLRRDGFELQDGDRGAAGEWAVVGHSLGNIITRLASPRLPAGFARFVMMAPPNSSPAIARELQDNPVFQALARDAGQRLCDEDFYETLPKPEVPSLIIAGERGVRGDWHPLGAMPNDAVVGVEETALDGVPQIVVPGVHTFLMNRRDVFALIRSFLDQALVEEVPEGARIRRPFKATSTPGSRL